MPSSGSIWCTWQQVPSLYGSQQQGNYSLSIVVVVHCPFDQCVVVVQCRTPFQLWWVLFLWNVGATPIFHLICSLSSLLEFHDLHLMVLFCRMLHLLWVHPRSDVIWPPPIQDSKTKWYLQYHSLISPLALLSWQYPLVSKSSILDPVPSHTAPSNF